MLNKHKVKHITTLAGAHGVERFNRTLKENTFKRLSAMGLEEFRWIETLKSVLIKIIIPFIEPSQCHLMMQGNHLTN